MCAHSVTLSKNNNRCLELVLLRELIFRNWCEKNLNEIFIALLLREGYQFCFLATALNSVMKLLWEFASTEKLIQNRDEKRKQKRKMVRKEWNGCIKTLYGIDNYDVILTCIIRLASYTRIFWRYLFWLDDILQVIFI